MSPLFFAPGDIVEYIGSKWHWFKEIKENSKLLELNKRYTIDTSVPALSWCRVTLKEFPGVLFCAGMFKRPDNFVYTKCVQCNGYGDYYFQDRFIFCKNCEGNGYSWKEKL